MAEQRPNFYVLLELDPSVRDPDAVKERIREKQNQWSRERTQGHPKARARAEQAQRWLKELERCFESPECWAREAREAEIFQGEERARHEEELQELIGYLGGVCDAERLDWLAEKFSGVFSREEIVERLLRAGVKLEGQGPKGDHPPEPQEELDRGTAREIRERLDLLGFADLYEFLALGRSASPAKLQEGAAQKLRENRRSSRRDSLVTAENDLASYCQEVFASEATKAAYDRYLTVAAMDRMRDPIELAGSDGFLSREAVDALVRKAGELGVEADAARAYIESMAREKGWKVDPGAASRPESDRPARSPEARPSDRYLAVVLPHLRRFARRPAVAVPAGLTVLGMSAVLAASVGAPSPSAQGTGAPPGQAAAAAETSAPPSSSAPSPPPPPSPTPSPPSSQASAGAGSAGGPAAVAGVATLPGPGDGSPEEPRADRSGGAPGPSGAGAGEPRAAPPPPPPPPPPPRRPTLPREPQVAVVAAGDDRVGALVEETVGNALREAGLEVRDARGSLALTQLLRASRGHPPVSDLAQALDAEGFDVLVLAELDAVGERRLEFYGRTELATTSRVRLTAYSLFDQRSLGGGWLDEVEHTPRGAAQQVPRAVAPGGSALAQQVADGWDRRLAEIGSRR